MSNRDYAIQSRGLTRRFGDFTAVNQLDLDVPAASIYGFLGPNGCGKTTTIRMLCGLLSPTSGRADILGLQIPRQAEQLRTRIGYMTQKFSLYEDLSCEENLAFIGKIFALSAKNLKRRIDELLSTYALSDMRKRRAGSMSGGQRQRLALAAATLHKPDLLFLDEPTSAVDPENRRDFWEKLFDLCDQQTTILVSTHYMDEAERCHKLAILESGEMRADGSPLQLMDSMGASVIEISADNLRQLKTRVIALANIKSAAQQGLRLRVLVDKSVTNPVDYLRQQLPSVDMQLGQVHPSLEDVFVTVTGNDQELLRAGR